MRAMKGGTAARPAILDFEASGLGASSYPIEVGVALGDGRKFCSLIAPLPQWQHWDPRAEALHGIGRELLAARGRAPAEVATELNGLVGEATLYSDGWVVDSTWFGQLFRAAGVAPRFRLSPLELILDEEQMANWHAVKDAVLAEHAAQRHRASFDAFVIQETWWRTRRLRAA